MDLMVTIIGFLWLAALVNNKELSGNDATDLNKDIYNFVNIIPIFMIFGGIGFLLAPSWSTVYNSSFQIPLYVFLAIVPVFTKGPLKVITTIGVVAIFVHVMILGY